MTTSITNAQQRDRLTWLWVTAKLPGSPEDNFDSFGDYFVLNTGTFQNIYPPDVLLLSVSSGPPDSEIWPSPSTVRGLNPTTDKSTATHIAVRPMAPTLLLKPTASGPMLSDHSQGLMWITIQEFDRIYQLKVQPGCLDLKGLLQPKSANRVIRGTDTTDVAPTEPIQLTTTVDARPSIEPLALTQVDDSDVPTFHTPLPTTNIETHQDTPFGFYTPPRTEITEFVPKPDTEPPKTTNPQIQAPTSKDVTPESEQPNRTRGPPTSPTQEVVPSRPGEQQPPASAQRPNRPTHPIPQPGQTLMVPTINSNYPKVIGPLKPFNIPSIHITPPPEPLDTNSLSNVLEGFNQIWESRYGHCLTEICRTLSEIKEILTQHLNDLHNNNGPTPATTTTTTTTTEATDPLVPTLNPIFRLADE